MWASARAASVFAFLAAVTMGHGARAETSALRPLSVQAPELFESGIAAEGLGLPIQRIEVVSADPKWFVPVRLRYVNVGERLSAEVARRALREVLATGGYASARAEVEVIPGGALLRLRVVPRRIVASVKLRGLLLDEDDITQATAVAIGAEIVFDDIQRVALHVRDYYDARGFPDASIDVQALDTDDPLRVSLVISVAAGRLRRVKSRVFLVEPRGATPEVDAVLEGYGLGIGDRLDARLLEQADAALVKELIVRGWQAAKVTHEVLRAASSLRISVKLGRRAVIEFEGNQSYDASQLLLALELDTREDRQPESLRERLRDFYARRGFWDATVELRLEQRGSNTATAYHLGLLRGCRCAWSGVDTPA